MLRLFQAQIQEAEMDPNDERDYAEEQFNANLLHEETTIENEDADRLFLIELQDRYGSEIGD